MDLACKAFSLLWKRFVETGPDESKLRWRLRSIRGFCSDVGLEPALCDLKDCLPEFLDAINCPLRVARATWLSPLAMYSTGWHHQWGNIARDAFESMAWWLPWLAALKIRVRCFTSWFLSKGVANACCICWVIREGLAEITTIARALAMVYLKSGAWLCCPSFVRTPGGMGCLGPE